MDITAEGSDLEDKRSFSKIYISYSDSDQKIIHDIASRLKGSFVFIAEKFRRGHLSKVVSNTDRVLNFNKKRYMESFRSASAFLVLMSEDYKKSSECMQEFRLLLSYAETSGTNVIIVVKGMALSDVNFMEDSELESVDFIPLNSERSEELEAAASLIEDSLLRGIGKSIANKQQKAEKIKRLESRASDYVTEAISGLKERERKLRTVANRWYVSGYAAILLGFLITVAISIMSFFVLTDWDWPLKAIIYLSFKSVVVIALVLVLSKYAFSLGKSNMDESLKNADRVHAISFGKFFLQAFGEDANPNEIKEVFEHWNIGGDNAFRRADLETIDPALVKQIINLQKVFKADSGV